MKNFVQWSSPAFWELERLAEPLAFRILRKVDLLASFPELGPDLGSKHPEMSGLRQLIIERRWRVIYEIDKPADIVWILSVQNCRQKLPSVQTLKRRKGMLD